MASTIDAAGTKVGTGTCSFVSQSLYSYIHSAVPQPLRDPSISLILKAGSKLQVLSAVTDKKKWRWFWPWGLLATGLAGAGVVIFRGCWHGKMSWPVRAQGHSYQVCLSCGIKRLFDENEFRAYGPYSYDLNRLIAWDQIHTTKLSPAKEHRSAS
jgi:hypothetical protein